MGTAAQRLEDELAALELKERDVLVQKEMFGHMIKRLEKDSIQLQRQSRTTQVDLGRSERDVETHALAVAAENQILKDLEEKFRGLQAKVQQRREVQEARAQGIRKVIRERSQLLEIQGDRARRKHDILTRVRLSSPPTLYPWLDCQAFLQAIFRFPSPTTHPHPLRYRVS